MPNTEKIWTGDAKMKYPKQWIVLVHLENDFETHKIIGIVHSVTPSKKEAYEKANSLENIMGRTVVIEGFNDTPQVGGLSLWNQ